MSFPTLNKVIFWIEVFNWKRFFSLLISAWLLKMWLIGWFLVFCCSFSFLFHYHFLESYFCFQFGWGSFCLLIGFHFYLLVHTCIYAYIFFSLDLCISLSLEVPIPFVPLPSCLSLIILLLCYWGGDWNLKIYLHLLLLLFSEKPRFLVPPPSMHLLKKEDNSPGS